MTKIGESENTETYPRRYYTEEDLEDFLYSYFDGSLSRFVLSESEISVSTGITGSPLIENIVATQFYDRYLFVYLFYPCFEFIPIYFSKEY
jgi:hypothetical protein